MDLTTGIVLGAIFGSLFIMTCVISAIKAVRDRKRIKERIAEREKQKLQNGHVAKEQTLANIATIEEETVLNTKANRNGCADKNGTSRGNAQPPDELPQSKSSDGLVYTQTTFPSKKGVDNMTYLQSCNDIECYDITGNAHPASVQETQRYLNTAEKRESQTKRSVSDDFVKRRERKLHHLSPECLAVQKNLRRHSYEVAICEHSWLPKEPPCFAPSREIINTYNLGKSGMVFENRAFDRDDHKKT